MNPFEIFEYIAIRFLVFLAAVLGFLGIVRLITNENAMQGGVNVTFAVVILAAILYLEEK